MHSLKEEMHDNLPANTVLGLSASNALVIRQIANIAHHGGMVGFGDIHEAMNEIRRLTLDYWDAEECDRLERR